MGSSVLFGPINTKQKQKEARETPNIQASFQLEETESPILNSSASENFSPVVMDDTNLLSESRKENPTSRFRFRNLLSMTWFSSSDMATTPGSYVKFDEEGKTYNDFESSETERQTIHNASLDILSDIGNEDSSPIQHQQQKQKHEEKETQSG